MNHEQIADLLGAYALDAVDPDEREVIERHLAGCARCRAEVQEHRETAALLAHTGGDAPGGVWERIAGSLEESPPRLRLAPMDDPRETPRRRVLPRLAVAVLAAAAVVVVVLGVQVRNQDQRIDELQTALEDPLLPAYQAALGDPASQVFELTSADGTVAVRGAVTPDGVGFLGASGLPPLADQRTYQLWGAAGDDLISLGVLGARPEVVSFRAEDYTAFAVTDESAPGVVVSTNHPVVAGAST